MLDQPSLVAVLAHGLLNRLTVVRGMLLTARSQLGPTEANGPVGQMLETADGNVLRMALDLERLARGLELDGPSMSRHDQAVATAPDSTA